MIINFCMWNDTIMVHLNIIVCTTQNNTLVSLVSKHKVHGAFKFHGTMGLNTNKND